LVWPYCKCFLLTSSNCWRFKSTKICQRSNIYDRNDHNTWKKNIKHEFKVYFSSKDWKENEIKNNKRLKISILKNKKTSKKFEGLNITEQQRSTGAEIFVFILCTIAIARRQFIESNFELPSQSTSESITSYRARFCYSMLGHSENKNGKGHGCWPLRNSLTPFY